MIIKPDKTYETKEGFPKSDWTNKNNVILDETKEIIPENLEEGFNLLEKVVMFSPNIQINFDDELRVINIIPDQEQENLIAGLKNLLEFYDKKINRVQEEEIVSNNKPVHPNIQKIINRKITIRNFCAYLENG